MGKLTALLLAGTVAGGIVGAARAADLPPPPPLEALPLEPVDFGGWYIRGDVGVGITSKPEIRSSFTDGTGGPGSGKATAASVTGFDQRNLDDAAFVGAGVGYQFNHWLRADITGEYRTAQRLSAVEGYTFGYSAKDIYTASIQSSVFLANGYVDMGTWYGITPFVGAGVGGSYNRVYGLYDIGAGSTTGVGNGGFGTAKDTGKFELAYAAHAGLSYAVTENLRLELAYRYLNMGEARSGAITCTTSCASETQRYKLSSNDVKLGMRWMFTDIAPVETYAPAPPLPLVRKD